MGKPNGQGGPNVRKEKLSRDVTNKLGMGSMSVKPVQVGPCAVSSNLRDKEIGANMKTHREAAQEESPKLNGVGASKEGGLGPVIGSHQTRPLGPGKKGDKDDPSRQPHSDLNTDGGGKEGAQQCGSAEQRYFGDVMMDAEAGERSAGHSGY